MKVAIGNLLKNIRENVTDTQEKISGKNLREAGFELFLQGDHDLAHGWFRCLCCPQVENMTPLCQVGVDDQFRFAGVGQNGPGGLGAGSLQQLQVHLFGFQHGLVPDGVFPAVLFKKHGLDKGNFTAEFIIAVATVTLALLEKRTGPMANDFVGNGPVDDEFYPDMPMFFPFFRRQPVNIGQLHFCYGNFRIVLQTVFRKDGTEKVRMPIVEVTTHGPDHGTVGMKHEHFPKGPDTAGDQQFTLLAINVQVLWLGEKQFRQFIFISAGNLQGDDPHFKNGVMPMFRHLGDKGKGGILIYFILAFVTYPAAEFDANGKALLIKVIQYLK